MASSGSSAPARPGRTYRIAIPRTRPVIVGFSAGSAQERSGASSRRSPPISTPGAASISARRSSTAPLPAPKKRAPCRENEAGQGDQDHGHCRRRWSSSRHYHRLGVAARNAARRADHKRQLSAATIPSGSSEMRAYDSDALDQTLAACGIELIAPNRPNRIHLTQDRRPLRRYKRRWKIERLFAWLQNYRRLVTRYESRPAGIWELEVISRSADGRGSRGVSFPAEALVAPSWRGRFAWSRLQVVESRSVPSCDAGLLSRQP